MTRQGQILARMAQLVDDGVIETIETRVLSGLSAKTMKAAHEIIETGAMVGKLVVDFRS